MPHLLFMRASLGLMLAAFALTGSVLAQGADTWEKAWVPSGATGR